MSKFKVGDKIKGKDNNYDVTNEDMILAEVIGVDGDSMSIEVINHKYVEWVGYRFNVRNSLDAFELAEPTLSFSFKVDDELWKELSGVTSLNISRADDSVDTLSYCVNDYLTTSKYVEKEEENDMKNEVLELWYSRNKENISKKYKEFKDKYFEERYSIIKEYNKLIEDFESNLEYLYNNSMSDLQPVLKENSSCNVFKYVVDKDKITDEAEEVYKEDEIKEYSNLNDTYKEIYALLSMSSDLEYQQSVLIEYGIIDKKTKRMRMISNEE